jgi:uncharacterized Zn finger protein
MLVKQGDKTYNGILFKKYKKDIGIPCLKCIYCDCADLGSCYAPGDLRGWRCRMFDDLTSCYIPRNVSKKVQGW